MLTAYNKPYFIECSVPEIKYLHGQIYSNHPVNLSLCTSISKLPLRWYPDNIGKPGLFFSGCEVHWAFDTAWERDAELKRIIKGGI